MSLLDTIRGWFRPEQKPEDESPPAAEKPEEPPLPDGDDSEFRGPRNQVS